MARNLAVHLEKKLWCDPDESGTEAQCLGPFWGRDTDVAVSYVWMTGVCEHGHPEESLVALDVEQHISGAKASALLTAEEALMLADRLTRAAHLVLEDLEQPPDVERKLQRFGE